MADRTKIENEHGRGAAGLATSGLTDKEKDIGPEKASKRGKNMNKTTPKESYALLGELQKTQNGKWALRSVYREG